jgi:hypothetical protein
MKGRANVALEASPPIECVIILLYDQLGWLGCRHHCEPNVFFSGEPDGKVKVRPTRNSDASFFRLSAGGGCRNLDERLGFAKECLGNDPIGPAIPRNALTLRAALR